MGASGVIHERFLVTGAFGCLGAWVVSELVREGTEVVTFDLAADDFRLRYLLADSDLLALTKIRGDVTDSEAVQNAMTEHRITNVVHLAGLQTPVCAADPSWGARVNVVGTVNVFAAVKKTAAAGRPIAYASSVAVYTANQTDDVRGAESFGPPGSHYGVYKLANENTARVFAAENDVASVGLRPYVVYGVGRDRGMTSAPTAAMLAAARGEPSVITFSGKCQMQYAQDVARAFIAATRSDCGGCAILNLDAPSVDIVDVVAAIHQACPDIRAPGISVSGEPLPFPARLPDNGVRELLGRTAVTSLEDGVGQTIDRFKQLISSGRIAEKSDCDRKEGLLGVTAR